MPAVTRVRSIDVLRGVVMVLMAIDHVRVYAGVPAGGPEPAVFFTRWVTHFCAPAFVFLAGTSAFLHGHVRADRGALSRFLVTRGLFLVVLELTVIKASWTFALDYSTFVLAGVIWMLGWCMVVMAALVWLPLRAIGIVGVALVAAHQVFGLVPAGWLWEFVYPAGRETPPPIEVLYTVVPWVGVMAAGYAFGSVLLRHESERRRWCLRVGLAATFAFVGIAATTAVTAPDDAWLPPVLLALNQQKYPPSQPYLLMTLGPLIALMPLADRATGLVGRFFETFGRVPMFYYLCHIPLIHGLALGAGWLRDGEIYPEWYQTAPYASVPPEHQWPLWLLYVVFAAVVIALYPLCRWFVSIKSHRRGGWLRYL